MNNININGQEIAFHESGNPDNSTILLLHGNSSSAEIYEPQLEELSNRYYLIAPDFPGHGYSGPSPDPDQYSFTGLAFLVLKFLKKLKIGPSIIYGHSLGGHVAIKVAEELPNLKGLIISGAAPIELPLDLSNHFTDSQILSLALKGDLSKGEIEQWAKEYIYNDTSATDLVANDLRRTNSAFRKGLGRSIAENRGLSDERKIVESFDFPLAFIQGEYEWLLNKKYVESIKLRKAAPQHQKTISESIHFPSIENPREFNRVLKDFCKYCLESN